VIEWNDFNEFAPLAHRRASADPMPGNWQMVLLFDDHGQVNLDAMSDEMLIHVHFALRLIASLELGGSNWDTASVRNVIEGEMQERGLL
jgi:hypothetical protein